MWHLDHIHRNTQPSLNDKHIELCNHIRLLHNLKEKTLAAHRDRYFFGNVEEYLQRATSNQMHNYITRYRPVILNSIRQATKTATHSMTITSFPGFVRTSNTTRSTHVSQEETPHRKHTRLRTLTRRITTFFRRKPSPCHPVTTLPWTQFLRCHCNCQPCPPPPPLFVGCSECPAVDWIGVLHYDG